VLTKLFRNKKGTAEIIGSVMFIVILLFFFTNVYLWHDAATKEMNDLYVQKLNSPIVIFANQTQPNTLKVTNVGGIDTQLSRLWVTARSSSESGGPDQIHLNFTLNSIVKAGQSIPINLANYGLISIDTETTHFTVVTTVGNLASCDYSP
jgi:hypothetical protein